MGRHADQTFPKVSSTFVGRDRERARLAPLFGHEALCLVHGLAGVGKSELLHRMAEDLATATRFRDARRARLLVPANAQPDDVLRELARVFDAPTCDAETLADAIDREPTVVVVDDAHHLPTSGAVALVSALASQLREGRLLVGSRRRIPVPAAVAGAVRIELGPLEPDAARGLARLLAERRGLTERDVERGCSLACGVPALLHAALSNPADPRPTSALASDLGALDREHRRILLALHFLDQPVPPRLLAQLGDRDADAAIAALIARSMLLARGETVEACPAAGAVLASLADPALASEAHLAVARIHEQRFRADPQRAADALAAVRQLRQGGDAGPAWQLLRESFEAAPALGRSPELLTELDAFDDSVAEGRAQVELLRARVLLRRTDIVGTREALERAAPITGDTAAHLTLAGRCATMEGQLDQAQALFERAVAAADDPDQRRRAALHLADVSSLRGDGAAARRQIDDVENEHGDASVGVHQQISRSLSYFVEEELERAFAADVAPELLARGGGDDLGLAMIAGGLLACAVTDDAGSARVLLGQLEQLGADRAISTAVLGLARGVVELTAGELGVAREELEAAVGRFEADRAILLVPVALEFLAPVLLGLGDLDGAARALERGRAIARDAGMRRLAVRIDTAAAEVRVCRGDTAAALAALDDVLSSEHAGRGTRSAASCLLARGHALEGDLRTGRRILRALEPGLRSAAEKAAHALATAELELLGGNPDSVVESARSALGHYEHRGCHHRAARAALALAAGHVARGRHADRILAAGQLDRVETAAAQKSYYNLQLGAALVRAALHAQCQEDADAERVVGDVLARSALYSGPSLELMALRAVAGDATAANVGVRAMLRVLGLDGAGAVAIIDRLGVRVASAPELVRELARRDLVVDTRTYTLRSRGSASQRTRPTACRVLARLISAGDEGIDAATLFCDVWRVDRFEPDQHRNTLHVTLNRLRRALRDVLPDQRVVETLAHGWRIAPSLDACAVAERPPNDRSLARW